MDSKNREPVRATTKPPTRRFVGRFTARTNKPAKQPTSHEEKAHQASAEPKKHVRTVEVINKKTYIRLRVPRKVAVWYVKLRILARKHRVAARVIALVLVAILLFSVVYQVMSDRDKALPARREASIDSLIGQPIEDYEAKLVEDKNNGFTFNKDYLPGSDVAGQGSGPKVTATFASSKTGAVTVQDPINKVGLTFTPKFTVGDPKKQINRIIYPIVGKTVSAIYSAKASGIKEDIVVRSFYKDQLSFTYELGLPQGTEARLENDGSLGVYGVAQALLGDVTTSSEKDAELLQKARQNSAKKTLLFRVPAPVVLEGKKKLSASAKARFTLEGKLLTVETKGLKDAKYPLSIDPSIYVESAAKLMRGNNETNTDFDVTNELIQKSQTTGARIDAWTSTSNLSSPVWGQGTTVAGGYIYSAGGGQGAAVTTTTYYAAGTSTYTVPAGVTSITVKSWGAGGGGGAGSGNGAGGAGGGGGYAKAVLTVTPAEVLDVLVGTAGTKAASNTLGGNGGGYSAVKRSAAFLVQAGGGGGGAGTRGSPTGGAGGAGGGSSGITGSAGTGTTPGNGGGPGTTSTGGTGGTNGGGSGAAGANGAANAGGNASPTATSCATAGSGTGGAGGTGAGGIGGTFSSGTCAGGGGGGGGRFGGGGGAGNGANNRAGGGGGGGSDLVTGTSTVETAGSGTTAGNNGDTDRSTAATGGTGGTTPAGATDGTAGAVVISYTVTGAAATSTVSWAKFNNTTSAIISPNPGTGACSGWCTSSVYDLPSALNDLSLLAYNGFLYAIGGNNIGGTPQTTVYIAELGANGEPQLWHPNGGTPVYWYTDTALSNARSNFGAVAYNNRIYILGGLTTASTVLSSNTVQFADIKPTGTLTTWSTTGMTALTSARYGLSAQVYNDVLYVLGGDATFTGSPITTVEYAKLNSDGTMNSWVTTTSISTSGRMTMGGSFSTIWGGYIYLAGGCTAVNGSGYCTSIATDIQIASINADGSLSEFNTIINLSNDRIGHTLIAWQGGLYRLGGCRAQDPSTGVCTNTAFDVDYGVINQDGEASTVATSVTSGTAPCNGSAPYSCDLPSASVGNMLNASVIVNGYLYIMGGCTNNACTTYSTGITYQAIGSDGTLQKPASCSGSYTDSYCVSSTSLPASRGAAGVAVFNSRIYLVGGFPSRNDIAYTTTNQDGSIGAWTSPTFASVGVTNELSYTFAYARANPASAGSNPGNLYVFGGCATTAAGIGCSGYTDRVYKCSISTAGAPSGCTTTGQMQIGIVTGDSVAGLGAHAGAVYANYIYLMGGLSPNLVDLKSVRYAKFDDSNNVVNVTSGLSSGSWIESPNQILVGRRRGAGFGYNGYLYVLGGYDGTDALADIEFARIQVSDGSIGAFAVSSVTINKRWGLTAPVSNSYAYVIGGCIAGAAPSSCTTRTNSIQTFQVYNNDSGALKSVTSQSDDTFSTATDRWGASSAILNGYLYVAGGCTSATDCTTATGDVQYAPISTSDGSIGTWSAATKGIGDTGSGAQVRAWGKLVVVGGYLYYLGGQDSTATNEQSTIYYALPSSGNISSNWAQASGGIGDTSGQVAQARTKFGVAVWDNRIYVIGGLDGSAAVTSTVFISPQLPSGGNIAADSWMSDSDVPDVARYGAAVTAYANNLYLFGGNDGTNYLNDGQFASLGYKTGTIAQSGTAVTGSGTSWSSDQVGKLLQYTDGTTATISSVNSTTSITVNVSRTIAALSLYTILDGSVGPWTFTTSTPNYISQGEAFAANGYLYVVGGRSAASTCSPNTFFAPISANTTIATGNNPTGVGEWSATNVRYAGGRYGAAVAYNQGKMYVMGGGCTSPIGAAYTTGTIAQTTTTVTGTGTNWTDNYIGGTITYADLSTATIVSVNSTTSLTVSVSKTVTAGNTYSIAVIRHTYAVLKSQPQVAIYSRMIDTDTDVFPNSWLMNGIDNSIGARWQVRYKSMHDINPVVVGGSDSVVYTAGTITQSGTAVVGLNTNWTASLVGATLQYADLSTATISSFTNATNIAVSVSKTIASAQNYKIYQIQQNPNEDCGTSSSMATMTTWGQETNFGSATLGRVEAYNPLNGSGGNINCARYYYFRISIDASQTFGYPEDVNRGPTINDISLFFSADPSRRLRHGKTFTGGEQQPLNTPCAVTGATPSGSQPNCPTP